MPEPTRENTAGRWWDEKAGCEVVSAEIHDRLINEATGYVDFWRDEALKAEEFIASKRSVRFEALCRGLISSKQYVASLRPDAR